MPITPLHYGILAPINHWFPGQVSLVSFTLVTLWIDLPSIMNLVYDSGYPAHGVSHSFVGVMFITLVVSSWALISRKRSWIWGAFLASSSHLFLDGLVHSDMRPFGWLSENPLYLGVMESLSLTLVPFTVWFVAQMVGWGREKIEALKG